MKKFNKIIAVLIVISILSSFVVSVSAGSASGSFQIRYTDTDGKQITSAKQGDIIDVYLAVNTNGNYISALQSDISYDVNLVKQTQAGATTQKTPTATSGREVFGELADGETMLEGMEEPFVAAYTEDQWAEKGFDPYCYLAGFFALKANPHKASFYPATWTDAQKAQYKIVRLVYSITYDEPIHCFSSTALEDVVRLRFIAQADIDNLDGSVIGFCEGGQQVLNCDGSGNNESINVFMAGVEVMTVTTSYAEAAAAPEVVLAGTMARMDKWEEADTTNVFDGGLMGQINNLPLEFDGKECTTIESIEVFLNGEKEAAANAYQVYKVDDTTYKFRAVITNMDKTSANYATDFTYKFVVTLDTGDTLEVEGSTSAKAIYEAAKANYDASIA